MTTHSVKMHYEWKSAVIDFESQKRPLQKRLVTEHPLQGVIERSLKSTQGGSHDSSRIKIRMDPLSSSLDGPDPLSQFLGDPLSSVSTNVKDRDLIDTAFTKDNNVSEEHWTNLRKQILARFTTNKRLTITSSFLQFGEKGGKVVPSRRRVVKTQSNTTNRGRSQGTTMSERVRLRLEQLDDLEEDVEVRELGGLSQEEFTARIDTLNDMLTEAWKTDQRVRALKIAIQCAKLLGDVSPSQFYPTKFVLVADILDNLASLIYTRLREKAHTQQHQNGSVTTFPEHFKSAMVSEDGQETTRNWLYKVASIRELLPRLYLEAAILPCYKFVNDNEHEKALVRLSAMVKGIANPLVAAYARMYICHVGVKAAPKQSQYVVDSIEDFILTFKQIEGPTVSAELGLQGLSLADYLPLFSPAVNWLLHCLARNAPHHILQSVLRHCESALGGNQSLLVSGVLNSFPPSFLTMRAVPLSQLIAGCCDPGFSQATMMQQLGQCVLEEAPPEHNQLPLLNSVWKVVSHIKDPAVYLSTAQIWLEFTTTHFTVSRTEWPTEVNTLLGDLLKHLTINRAYEQLYPQLLTCVQIVLHRIHHFHTLYSMSNFQQLLGLFQRDSVGVEVTRCVVQALVNQHEGSLSDPTPIAQILTLCSTMHDSVNALTTEDERRQITHLINAFILKVDFGIDFEQQLDFYVEARGAFSNLEGVLVNLVQCVCHLTMLTFRGVRGHHSGKTAAFVRACAAYCYITIPSLGTPSKRMQLYLLAGQVAYVNQCLGQGDACLKGAIREVLSVPATVEAEIGKTKGSSSQLLQLVCSLASTLVAIPDAPDTGALYLMRGLVTAVKSHSWQEGKDEKALAYITLIRALAAVAQEQLPYHFVQVEGNDAMYGGDPRLAEEAQQLASGLLQDVLHHIQTLEASGQGGRMVTVALHLLWCVTNCADLNEDSMQDLVLHLISLACQNTTADNKFLVQSKTHLRERAKESTNEGLCKLVTKFA
ncbi:VPS35 endosomal protein-sorting factor-like isoform X2 [Oratosquilla oratoria]|uniref:VPS35 endosomal protein-sorting factor-like isoform X2 n=1 Tax=Oratosquilla oratoria TaxID=337810 RepID=UPI003F76D535